VAFEQWRTPSATETRPAAESPRAFLPPWATPTLRDRLIAVGALLLCAVLTFAVYGAALRFAFTFDDPLDLPRAEGRSVWSIFTSSAGYAYYRPIPFVIWKLLRALQGSYNEATLHGLTLICHLLAAWFLALLLRRLTGNWWGIVASILFITYPFSYQAAFGAHTLFHPLMTAALLLALLLYCAAREHVGAGGPALRAAAVGAAVVGLWTHESGAIILPLVVGLELFLGLRERAFVPFVAARRILPFVIVTALFLLTWAIVPKFARPDPWSPASLGGNARFFLEGTIWPVAAQLNRLGGRFGFDPTGALWPAIVLTLLVLIALYVVGRRPWVPLLALAGTAIILFPAWLVLTWVYVEDAPRLLYPAAPAIAALWGLLPSLRFPNRVVTRAWRGVSLLILLAVTVQSLNFIGVRRDMWAEGTVLIHGVADTAVAWGDCPLLFLNVPAWFAPKDPEYPVGHVGLTALPGYVGLGRSVYIQRGIQPPLESRGFYPDVNGWKYDFNTHGGPATLDEFAALIRQVDAVYTVDMRPEGARIRQLGTLTPNGADQRATDVRWGGAIALRTAAITFAPGGLRADLTWDTLAPPPGDVLPAMRVRDASGAIVGERREYPLGGIAAPRLWQAGDRVRDITPIALPADLPAGAYTIWLSWEEKTTRALLGGADSAGVSLPAEGAMVGQFTLP
jgi:hypothetical protein